MQFKHLLCIILITSLLSSCGKKLDSLLEDAEKAAHKGDTSLAIQNYSNIAEKLVYSSPDYLGYEYEKVKAYTLLWNSIEATLSKEQQINFIKRFIRNTATENYFKKTQDILKFSLKSIDNDSTKCLILNEYLSNFKSRQCKQEETLSEIISLIISVPMKDERQKLGTISKLYETIDTSSISSRIFTELDERAGDSLPRYNVTEQLLNRIFRDSILSLIQFDTIEIKPTPEEISSLQDTFQLFPVIDSIPFRKDNDIHLSKCVPVLISPQKSVLLTVSSFYFALPEQYQARSFDEIEQILIIKPIRIQIGEYGGEGIVTHKPFPGYDRKVGIYYYDVSKKKVVDAQTINCGKGLKSITLNTTFSERFGAFPSQEIVSYLQGVADSSVVSSDLHLQIAFEQFINGMEQSESFEKRIKELGISRLY